MLSFSASPATRVADLSIKGGEVVYQSRERERERGDRGDGILVGIPGILSWILLRKGRGKVCFSGE